MNCRSGKLFRPSLWYEDDERGVAQRMMGCRGVRGAGRTLCVILEELFFSLLESPCNDELVVELVRGSAEREGGLDEAGVAWQSAVRRREE